MKKFLFLSMVAAMMLTACGGQSGKNENAADSLALSEEPAPITGLNADLLGQWDNNNDPNISMMVSDKYGKFNDWKCYGYLQAANEYFEYDYLLIFTNLIPDGDRIRVCYDKMEQQYDGDPDDPDGEGQWVTKKVGSGEFILVSTGDKKLKIEGGDKRIEDVTLYQ